MAIGLDKITLNKIAVGQNTIPSIQRRCIIAAATIPDGGNLPLTRLSATVIAQSARFNNDRFNAKRHQQYLVGRILLAELLFKSLAITQLPEIKVSDNGRPSFCHLDLPDFNISHSGNQIMVALAIGCQIGIDLELAHPRPRLLALAKYSFSETEYQWLLELPVEQQEAGFWQLWTLRESILKLAGKGVWQMKQLRINPLRRQINADFNLGLTSWSAKMDATFWALTSDSPLNEQQIELWQFDWLSATLNHQLAAELIRFRSDSKH